MSLPQEDGLKNQTALWAERNQVSLDQSL